MDEFEKWFEALNEKHDFLVWKRLAHRDTALEAWNAALTIGEARGRVLGMGEAAEIVEQKAEQVREANTFRGRINQYTTAAVDWMLDSSFAIRRAAAQPPVPTVNMF